MSDLENKLRNLPFRTPPASLRRDILAAAESGACSSKWRDWLWPSPLAWGGIAALWIFLLGCNVSMRPAGADFAEERPPQANHGPSFAMQSHRELSALLENLN